MSTTMEYVKRSKFWGKINYFRHAKELTPVRVSRMASQNTAGGACSCTGKAGWGVGANLVSIFLTILLNSLFHVKRKIACLISSVQETFLPQVINIDQGTSLERAEPWLPLFPFHLSSN